MHAALRGDTVAFGTVFEWCRPRLRLIALRYCGNTPLAQDAVQDAFIAAFTHLNTLRDASLVMPWLKKITANTCLQLLRKEGSSAATQKIFSHESQLDSEIDRHFENQHRHHLLFDLLQRLSDELRACVLLRYFSDCNSYDAISIALGIPIGTVRSRLAAAREKLFRLSHDVDDSSDQAFGEANRWTEYYRRLWSSVHHDESHRRELFSHIDPEVNIRFTGGKVGAGRCIVEKEIDDDLRYGSNMIVHEVASSGNLSVIDVENVNSTEYADRCPPSSTFVVFREKGQIRRLNIFHSLPTR